VAIDEILIEIETDKVVLEVPAPAAGVLAELVVADGATVAADQVIARIDTEGKAGAAAPRRRQLQRRHLLRRSGCARRRPPARPVWPCPPPPS
jgi:pyruvate/2-oxoglutarate dehydrogenase complex dihydrolipoamide acyltransferase (E2) component